MASKTYNPVHNLLLASLPADQLGRLIAQLEPVELPLKQTLTSPNKPVETVYFPVRGMVSLVHVLQDGTVVEVGMIGREGFVGISAILDGTGNAAEAMVQIAGSAFKVSVRALQDEVEHSPQLRSQLLRYVQSLLAQISQTVACNRHHTLQQRLARWLLMARDRLDDDVIPLTHEFLSMMLGARRAGTTVALGALKHDGIIANSTGSIRLLDRARLETGACECYAVVREQYKMLLAPHH